jgi:hypothetical protein
VRKQYALRRLRLATYRLMLADSNDEKTFATRWVIAWAGAIGNLQFSAIIEGRLGYKLRRRSSRLFAGSKHSGES